jgi:lipoprotein-anchoring transpeptidase ErfK/SrfK
MKLQNEMPGVNAGNLKPTPGPGRGGSSSQRKSPKKRNLFLPAILVVMGCVVLVFAAWSAVRSPVLASILGSSTPAAAGPRVSYAYVEIAKPVSQPQSNEQLADIPVTPTLTLTTEPTLVPTTEAVVNILPDLPTLEPTVVPTNTEAPTLSVTTSAATPAVESTGVAIAEIVQDTPTSNYVAPTNVPNAPLPVVGDGVHWLDVDLSQQRLSAYAGDTLVNSFIVSTGTWQTPTVTGSFKVWVKLRSSDMSGPGYYLPDVPYVMYFYKDYGIHGTYWHNNFGTPMSHGCVNLSIADAEWVYNFSAVGTVVNVHY